MFPPRWFLPYDAIFQLITAFVALAVALYALKGHQWIRERTLYFLFLAFLLLSVGLFVNGMTLTYAQLMGISFTAPSDPLSIVDLGFWTYYAIQILAYSLLVFAYAMRLRGSALAMGIILGAGGGGPGPGGGGGAGGAGSTLISIGPFAELSLVILLLIIVVAQLAHMVVKRSTSSIMVTFSFLLLLMSHLLIMFSSLEDIVYVIGRSLELVGFLSLLGVLLNLRRGG